MHFIKLVNVFGSQSDTCRESPRASRPGWVRQTCAVSPPARAPRAQTRRLGFICATKRRLEGGTLASCLAPSRSRCQQAETGPAARGSRAGPPTFPTLAAAPFLPTLFPGLPTHTPHTPGQFCWTFRREKSSMQAQNLRHRRWHQAEASRDGKWKEEALGTARETPSRRAAGAGAIAPTRRGTGTRPAPATRNLRSPLVRAQRDGNKKERKSKPRNTREAQ